MKKKSRVVLLILGVLIIIGSATLCGLLSYGFRHMASEEISNMKLPGDNLLKDEDKVLVFTKDIIINAPPAKIWPHLAQMGQTKAGWYSFELLEQIFTFDIHNTYEIKKEWQDMKPGEWKYYHQMGIGSEVIEVVKDKYFTMLSDSRRPPVNKGKAFALRAIPGGEFAWTWNFILQELPGNKTRLIQRCQNYFSPNNIITRSYVKFFLGIPSLFMTTRQMDVLKACAEGRITKDGSIKE